MLVAYVPQRIRGRLLVAATGVAPLCGVKVVHESGGGTGCAESNVALGYDSVPVKNNFPMEPVQFGHRSSVQSSYSGGIVVDDAMRTGLRDVYAAGDCCTLAHWTERSPDWLPMRLWSQVLI
jgi:NADPH-dependent 2,4-dienoyl-CoA reductase/sulfur reductase-like enzyme